MTDRALTMLINKVEALEPLSIDRQKQKLKNAIMGNWKSVYPIKEDVRQSNVFADNEYDYNEIERLMNKMQNAECKMQN